MIGIKKLHIYVVKSYIGPLVLTFFISMLVLLMQFVWKYVDDLVGKGLEWQIITELLTYVSAGLVTMALPLAVLLASLMTFGNLGENYELTALKSAGISLPRIMYPLIVISVITSVGAFYFSNYVIPYTNLKAYSLLYDITHQRPELSIKIGAFNNDMEGYSMRINRRSKKSDMLYDIMIYDHTAGRGNPNVTVADSGTMRVTKDKRYMIITLFNGNRYEELEEQANRPQHKKPHRRDKFEKQTSIIELSGFQFNRTDQDLFKNNFQMLNLKQLTYVEDSLLKSYERSKKEFSNFLIGSNYFKRDIYHGDTAKMKVVFASDEKIKKADLLFDLDSLFNAQPNTKKVRIIQSAANYARYAQKNVETTKMDLNSRMRWIKRHQIEWHRKFSLSFACFIFFFIGAPLGAIIRKGGLGMPVVISVVFFIMYYIFSLTGEKFAREDILSAVNGMWFSSFILLPLGVFLTYKAANDSVIMDIDTYMNFYKRIFKKFKHNKAL